MKKILALIMSAIMMLSLVACGSGDSSTDGDVKTYKVGVAIYEFNDNFMTLYREELENYFASKETDTVKYDVQIVDGKTDMAEQTNQIRNFITQGVDVIICNLVQTSSADTIIDEVAEAGIPLVLVNREPLAYDAEGNPIDEAYEGIIDNDKVCYVGADARQSGTYQGEIVLSLADNGDLNGDGKVSYIMAIGDPENIDAQYRTEYSIKALTDAGVKVEKLAEDICNWQQTEGEEFVSSALAAHGDKIEVVFCNNDGMALGAAAAIQKAGRTVGKDIYLLGVDALTECIEMIGNGEMTGTVLNDHIGQSHTAVDVAIKLLAGEEIGDYYWVDYVKVDKDYVDAQ